MAGRPAEQPSAAIGRLFPYKASPTRAVLAVLGKDEVEDLDHKDQQRCCNQQAREFLQGDPPISPQGLGGHRPRPVVAL